MKTRWLLGLLVIVAGCGKTPSTPVASKPMESATSSQKAQKEKADPSTDPAADPTKEIKGAKTPDEKPAGRWVVQASGVTDDLKDVHFLDSQLGFVVGHGNTILRTTDGGLNWKRLLPPKPVELRQVFFVNPKVGWACTSLVGTILHTTDGGDSWTVVKLPGPAGPFSPAGSNFGSQAAVGNRYWLLYWGLAGTKLQYTDDAGKEWKEIKLPFKFPDAAGAHISFIDANNGCIVWKGPSDGQLAFTDNGGRSWRTQTLKSGDDLKGNYLRVQVVNPKMAYVIPHVGTIFVYSDGGYATRDMGHTRTGDLADLHFADAHLGHVLVNYTPAEVRRTTDGCKTWSSLGKLQNPGHVTGVSFPDRNHGWVVGDKGYIEHYHEEK